jgi:hypothetical protein
MPEYPVRPQHPYGSDPAEESPTRAPYPRGRSVRGEGEYQRRPDDYGNAQDGDRGWDRPSRGDWSGPDERAAWKDTDRREDRSAYGRQNRLDRQAQEELPEPPARPLSRRARREAERGRPEAEGEPTTWGNDETEPRWNGRSRLPIAP